MDFLTVQESTHVVKMKHTEKKNRQTFMSYTYIYIYGLRGQAIDAMQCNTIYIQLNWQPRNRRFCDRSHAASCILYVYTFWLKITRHRDMHAMPRVCIWCNF